MKIRDFLKEGYEPDTFYNVDHIRDKIKFLKDCISKSYKVLLDELDCNVSFARKPTKASVDDIFTVTKTKGSHSYYVFIIRRMVYGKEKPYIEAGVRTVVPFEKDYFIWIHIKVDKLDYFIKKYKLKIL